MIPYLVRKSLISSDFSHFFYFFVKKRIFGIELAQYLDKTNGQYKGGFYHVKYRTSLSCNQK